MRPIRGQMFWCKWYGVADSFIVRVAAKSEDGWSLNRYGHLSWIAEVAPQVFTPAQETQLEREKSSFREDRREIESNLEWGSLDSRSTYITVADWLLSPCDTDSLRPLWVKWGRCPHCGHEGEWISLALICPYHGTFAG